MDDYDDFDNYNYDTFNADRDYQEEEYNRKLLSGPNNE